MTDAKKVSDVTKERMLSDVLRQLRATQQMFRDINDNRRKLIQDRCEVDWYPDYQARTGRDIEDMIDLSLRELGKCAERKNNENKGN